MGRYMTVAHEKVKPFSKELPTATWLGPPLRTLHQSAFEAACAELMRQVEAHFQPTLIVGIRSGGLIVAQSMADSAQQGVDVLPVTSRRSSTAAKERVPFMGAILKMLPRPAVDALRRIEHRWMTAGRARRSHEQWVDMREVETVAQRLQSMLAPRRLLVVDDAVDSGVTFAAVMQRLKAACPHGTEFHAAAITQTMSHPLLVPDDVLYHGALCRFPWSFDATE
jgi:hypoxanthine phosphoribosyltransferase